MVSPDDLENTPLNTRLHSHVLWYTGTGSFPLANFPAGSGPGGFHTTFRNLRASPSALQGTRVGRVLRFARGFPIGSVLRRRLRKKPPWSSSKSRDCCPCSRQGLLCDAVKQRRKKKKNRPVYDGRGTGRASFLVNGVDMLYILLRRRIILIRVRAIAYYPI